MIYKNNKEKKSGEESDWIELKKVIYFARENMIEQEQLQSKNEKENVRVFYVPLILSAFSIILP